MTNNEIIELGNIDKSLYSCISDKIDTTRVIITNKQLIHIAAHHPEAYESLLIELKDALTKPDYIFRGNRPNTGIVIKSIAKDASHIYAVLKLCTDSRDGALANSVISGWIISETRLVTVHGYGKVP